MSPESKCLLEAHKDVRLQQQARKEAVEEVDIMYSDAKPNSPAMQSIHGKLYIVYVQQMPAGWVYRFATKNNSAMSRQEFTNQIAASITEELRAYGFEQNACIS